MLVEASLKWLEASLKWLEASLEWLEASLERLGDPPDDPGASDHFLVPYISAVPQLFLGMTTKR